MMDAGVIVKFSDKRFVTNRIREVLRPLVDALAGGAA
jgi:hypothetical protein